MSSSSSGPPPTSPKGNGLFAWFRADNVSVGANDTVDAWRDNASLFDAVQPDPGLRPLFVASALNSQPGVRFSGAQYLSTTSQTTTGHGFPAEATGFTIFMVVSGPNPQSMVRFQETGTSYVVFPWGPSRLFIVSTETQLNGLATGLTGITENDWNLAVARYQRAPGTLDTWRNGFLQDTRASVSTAFLPGDALVLGALRYRGSNGVNVSEYANAMVTEILIYDRALTEAEIDWNSAYLKARYALSY